MKASEEKLHNAHAYTKAVIGTIHEPLVVLDRELRVDAASDRSMASLAAALKSSFGRPLLSIDAHHLDDPGVARVPRSQEGREQ